MDVAITGTPGVGKTILGDSLRSLGAVLSVSELALEYRCAVPSEEELEVDVSSLAALMAGHTAGMGTPVFLEGHLSHLLPVDIIIVLRLKPCNLRERLDARGYRAQKILENVEAEFVGVCLSEAVETGLPVAEVDCTDKSVREIHEAVEEILKLYAKEGGFSQYAPGNVDWLEGEPWV